MIEIKGTSYGIPPYRMNLIMKTAADVTNVICQGKHLYNPTYEECEIILAVVGKAVEESKGGNKHVFKQDAIQKNDQIGL